MWLPATKFTLNAKAEVILSAGAVQSPQLLILSGIGDATALGALGITTIVDNTNVGQNMQDHAFLTNSWKVNPDVFT
jgi:choline dehydrogenase-like flavoprotein